MYRPIQFTSSSPQEFGSSTLRFAGVLLGLLLLWPAARAQETPFGAAGRVEGNDVSVQGPSAPRSDDQRAGSSILVGSGSIVTVHSGQARMILFGGGEVDICGPAKFTLLQSGDAVTLAVELGRMRVHLPASATLRLFTPTIVATPLEISGGERDITVGLDQDDSLCVLAASGAIQLEHQFSGERLIVPQTGEFFLNAGKLLPVVGRPGSCQCAAMQALPASPEPTQPPEYGANMAPLTVPLARPTAQPAPAQPPNAEFSIPAHANEAHPVAPPEKNTATPVASMPVYTVAAPPLAFSASSPSLPPEPPIDTFLLVREAQVAPKWEFKGRVDPPTFAGEMQRVLGEGPLPTQPPAAPRRKRGGFWGIFHRIFAGNGAQD